LNLFGFPNAAALDNHNLNPSFLIKGKLLNGCITTLKRLEVIYHGSSSLVNLLAPLLLALTCTHGLMIHLLLVSVYLMKGEEQY
jgi:hypothetical protein